MTPAYRNLLDSITDVILTSSSSSFTSFSGLTGGTTIFREAVTRREDSVALGHCRQGPEVSSP